MKKTKQLGTENIGKLLFKLSLPSTIGMMVIMLYHAADILFVGRGVGTEGIAGITIVFPIQMLISAFGQMMGVGGASIISRALGAKDLDRANKTLTNIALVNFIFSSLIGVLIFINMEFVLKLFGSSETILLPATEYFSIIILSAPILSFLMMINNIFRAEGNANLAMYVMITSAAVNIILDPIFIFIFEWGIQGAAIATVLAEILAFSYVLVVYKTNKSIFSFKFRSFSFDWSILKETFAVGASSFIRQGGSSVTTGIMNNALLHYGGDIAIAAFGLVFPIIRFVFFPLIGLVQGAMPILGYNYGSKNYKRVLKTLEVSNIYSIIISVAAYLFLMFYTEQLLSIFSTDSALIQLGVHAMKIAILLLPFVGFQMITSGYFQALGKALPSLVLVIVRQFLAPVFFILTLPIFFGLDGIWIAYPLADLIAIIMSLIYIVPQFRILKRNTQ